METILISTLDEKRYEKEKEYIIEGKKVKIKYMSCNNAFIDLYVYDNNDGVFLICIPINNIKTIVYEKSK